MLQATRSSTIAVTKLLLSFLGELHVALVISAGGWFVWVLVGFCVFFSLDADLKRYIDKEDKISRGQVYCCSPPLAAIRSLANQGAREQSAFQRRLPECCFFQS